MSFPGDILRERREALNLTVTDVYKQLRIPVRCVIDIERGALDALPAPCYVVGFLKSYCELLRLDSDRFVDQYRACVQPVAPRFLQRNTPNGPAWPEWMRDALTWAAICGIIAMGWLAYHVVVRPDAGLTDGRVDAGMPDASELSVPPPPADGSAWGF